MAEKRFYWLKLQKDFFKRHDTKVIKAMPNGKDYLLFYLTLLAESISHDGYSRFSDTIPYNDEMLAAVTDTNVDVVRSAVKLFCQLGLMEILDDKTIFMTEAQKMMGGEGWSTERMRRLRERQASQPQELPSHVTDCDDHVTKSKSKSKSKDTILPEKSGESDSLSVLELFERTYKAYPRHISKAKSLPIYKALLTKGRQIAGQKVRLNHEQIYFAVQAYADEMQGKDEQYIQHFTTFLGSTVLDYVEQTKEQYEAWMKDKYGSVSHKFEYRE